ncbi:MAG TPA: TRZ/ATZ family hydrolase [Burkholderiales bacterium]|nr:TRZ/ATZ family hydrolase [Burkholderiales bacterium]
MQDSQAAAAADLVIEARWVIPVDPPGRVLENHAVAISGGRILALLPADEAARRYPSAPVRHLGSHVLIPGLVNLHTHAAMTLMRGLADDLRLMDWLSQHIWPAEAAHVSPQFVYDGTLLACAEMLRGGVTCFNDMYFFPEMAARAAIDAGMRAALGVIVIEFPTAYASDAQDYLRKGLAMRDEFRHEPLLSFCMAPHAPYTVADRTFEQVLTLSEQLQIPVHMHLHETADEIRESLSRFGMRPLARLEKIGLLGPNFIAVHAVHLDPGEIALLGRLGCSVAHCPSSNLKLASGIAPVADMLSAGIGVGLGTDGAASNNRLDVLAEMRTAALLAKTRAEDPRALPAHAVLRMATLDAARALGLERSIGSIEAGKLADLCAVNLDAPELSPCYDPASHLAYAAGREHVSDVWVAGRQVVDAGGLCSLDAATLKRKAGEWKSRIARPQ